MIVDLEVNRGELGVSVDIDVSISAAYSLHCMAL